jgi:hypothetical protein
VAQFWSFVLPRLAASPDHGLVSTVAQDDLGG